jgi:hypothetical protein
MWTGLEANREWTRMDANGRECGVKEPRMGVNGDGGLGVLALQRLNSETQVRSVVVVATNGSEPDFWCKGIRGGG